MLIRCIVIRVIGGNISAGKSTLGALLKDTIADSIFLEEKFSELKKLPLFYEECQLKQKSQDKHNKFALDLQLEFLAQRYDNEMYRNSISGSNLILDRCIFEDYHIFTKTQLELGQISRNNE